MPWAVEPVIPLASTKRSACAATWTVFWRTRLLVWIAGCAGLLGFGLSAHADPPGMSRSFGAVGNLLVAPAVRWDALWYLRIAGHGYQTAREVAFCPLYPLLMRAVSVLTGSLAAAGIVISMAGLLMGLIFIRRLTELELGPRAASATVELLAVSPVAVYLSAVYTEGLFLALSAGSLYCARRGRWFTAGLLGGLAALTRVTGVVLAVPLLLLFFYGPRGDRPLARAAAWWKPRYRITPSVMWIGFVPAGAAAFALYLQLRGFGGTGTVAAQQHFSGHQFVFPLVGAWQGAVAALTQFRLELIGIGPVGIQDQAIFQFGVLILAVAALVPMVRRVPFAYSAYAICGLLVALSTPTAWAPLAGLARYVTVLFPLYMGVAAWAAERQATRRLVIGSALLMCLLAVQFATWHMPGTPAI